VLVTGSYLIIDRREPTIPQAAIPPDRQEVLQTNRWLVLYEHPAEQKTIQSVPALSLKPLMPHRLGDWSELFHGRRPLRRPPLKVDQQKQEEYEEYEERKAHSNSGSNTDSGQGWSWRLEDCEPQMKRMTCFDYGSRYGYDRGFNEVVLLITAS
jgi:hypothetical protein